MVPKLASPKPTNTRKKINAPNVPHGALCLVALCQPGELPLDFFASRPDLRRVVYTLESPNVRHAAQCR
jgi:hypothetical protein